jgi:hypothetical protein
MAEATKKAAAKKPAAKQPVQQGQYETLEDRPDADQGNGTLARNIHLMGDKGITIFEAGTESKDLPDWAMAQLTKNPKAWAHDDEDE